MSGSTSSPKRCVPLKPSVMVVLKRRASNEELKKKAAILISDSSIAFALFYRRRQTFLTTLHCISDFGGQTDEFLCLVW